MNTKTLTEELKDKYPGLAKRAQRQAKCAIKLFCYTCYGGSIAMANDCKNYDCPLWPLSPAASKINPNNKKNKKTLSTDGV